MKLIDLSHPLNGATPVFPGDHPTSLTKHTSLEEEHFTSYVLTSTMHTGTHVDVPMHLIDDARTVADFPLDKYAGKGVLLDVRGETVISMKPRYRDIVSEDSVVLLYTGFDARYGTAEYFTYHPHVSRELAEFLISRKIKMIGIDMPSPDHSPYVVHKALLENDIVILENLTNLHPLTQLTDFIIAAFPLKISAEASLVRAVCIV
jgi:Predicted metal-dependent hydrolase